MDEQVKQILSTKLNVWSHEAEIRYITDQGEHERTIGTITGVYFGMPYRNTVNFADVLKHSRAMREYDQRVRCIAKIARDRELEIRVASIESGEVATGAFDIAMLDDVRN